jgi:hypothetical protein
MAIVESNVLNISKQSEGRYHCTFNYILDDGREINIKPSSVGEDYQQVCEDRSGEVFKSVIKSDAQEALELGIKTAHKYATQEQVFYEFLFAGYNEPDPIAAYDYMNGIAQSLLSLGLTAEQFSALFGETVEITEAVINYWHVLAAGASTIEAYRTLKEGLIHV